MRGRARPTYEAAVAIAVTIAASGAAACGGDGYGSPDEHRLAPTEARAALSRADDRALVQLRGLLAQYRKPDDAIAAGWSTRVTDCMADPQLGGMGVHFADLPRFDASLDPMRPEILVYATVNGAKRLVAAEFAVPLSAWTSSTPPVLFGQPFHVNTQFQLWVLHVWEWYPNPSGLFADWNPRVTCP